MKSKTDGLIFVTAVLAIAAALFMPLSVLDPSFPGLEQARTPALGPVLAWFVGAAGFWAFKVRFWSSDERECRRLSNLAMLLVLQAVLLRTAVEVSNAFGPLPWPWVPQDAWVWVPWFVIPGITGMLLGARFGVFVCLSGALMLYLLARPGPLPLMGCMTSALVGVLLLRRSPTRSRVLRSGTATGAALGIITVTHYALHEMPVDAMAAALLLPLLIGMLSGFVALAFLPVLEWVLGELSDVTLIEYGTDHRLLDELRTKAPGTWHHSLNVADLAEKGAAECGARALFCKAAALYHDIGKLKEPQLFVENIDGPSPHDGLEPHESAQRIIEHVPHGLELARKHGLPKPFREIIAEHHGISIVRFFYSKACKPGADGAVVKPDRAPFTYPGPPPSTKESGIIALADAVEAASRSLTLRTEPELRSFVRHLFAERISDGELAQCPLTLADLAKIEAAFVNWLKGSVHVRPAYPAASEASGLKHLPQPA